MCLVHVKLLQLQVGQIEAVEAETRDDDQREEGHHLRRQGECCVGGVEGGGCNEDGEREQPEVRGGERTQAQAGREPAEDIHAEDPREGAGGTEDGEGSWRDVLDLEVGGEDDIVWGENSEV